MASCFPSRTEVDEMTWLFGIKLEISVLFVSENSTEEHP